MIVNALMLIKNCTKLLNKYNFLIFLLFYTNFNELGTQHTVTNNTVTVNTLHRLDHSKVMLVIGTLSSL